MAEWKKKISRWHEDLKLSKYVLKAVDVGEDADFQSAESLLLVDDTPEEHFLQH